MKRAVYAVGVGVICAYFGAVWLVVSALATVTGHGRQRRG